jgi:hypothetical protein
MNRTGTFAMLAAFLAASPVRAEESRVPDGVYGRFDGDLNLSLAAGPTFAGEGTSGTLLARAYFLETAGAFVAYTDRLGEPSSGPRRSLAVGVTIRPLFVPRWGLNLEKGPAILDLTLDATAIELGALWVAEDASHFDRPPGLELALATEVPLSGGAEGLWIGARGSLRWRDTELSGANDGPALGPALLLTVAWHILTGAHLVDAGDRLMR